MISLSLNCFFSGLRPLLQNESYRKLDNAADFAPFEGRYFFTPKKMGAQTEEANVNAGLAAARQIVAFFNDGTDRFRVN